LSGSTWQLKQHSPYSNHQRVCHRRLEDGRWNGAHPIDVVIEDTIPLEPNLTYKTHPIKILDQQDRVTHNVGTQRFLVIQLP
jgi:hypothetical protein